MPSEYLLYKLNKNEILPNLCNAFPGKNPTANHTRTSVKRHANISCHIPQIQFSTLPVGIMLQSMQPPVIQELKVESNVPQFNNQSTSIPISDCVQTSSNIQESTHSTNVMCFINTVPFQTVIQNIQFSYDVVKNNTSSKILLSYVHHDK